MSRPGTGEEDLLSNPFEVAKQAEGAIAALYSVLATKFVEKPELRALFTMLAEEERSHVRRVVEFERRWKAAGHLDMPDLEAERMTRLTERIDELRVELAASARIDPVEAVRLAGAIEKDFHAVHAEAMAKNRDPLCVAFFAEMSKLDGGHRELDRRMMELIDRKKSPTNATPAPRVQTAAPPNVPARPAPVRRSPLAPKKANSGT